MHTMYKKLLQLPLFQGLNQADITEIIEKVKLHFQTIPANSPIIKQEENCTKLFFLLEGSLTKVTNSKDQVFRIEQSVSAPCLLEPQSLFGLAPTYQASYSTISECDIMTIEKSYVLSELMNYPIFELNYLNILSRNTHSLYNLIWENKYTNELSDRFKYFIKSHVDNVDQPITLYITMEDLAFQLNDTRLNVSKMLNELKDRNMISLKRKIIHIPSFHTLK